MKLDPTVHIFARNGIAKVFIDGAEIPNVLRIEFVQDNREYPCVQLTIEPHQVTMDTDGKPNVTISEE